MSGDIFKTKLEEEIKEMTSYFNYIGINLESLSSSLTAELSDFVNFMKDKKYLFSFTERKDLLFDNVSNDKNDIINSNLNINNDSLINDINFIKQKLIMIKQSIEEIHRVNKKDDIILAGEYKLLLSNLHDLTNKNKQLDNNDDKNLYHIGNKNIILERINLLNTKKEEISKLNEYKHLLIKQKENLTKKLIPYENIPTDIDLLKALVNKRKEEYNKLKNN